MGEPSDHVSMNLNSLSPQGASKGLSTSFPCASSSATLPLIHLHVLLFLLVHRVKSKSNHDFDYEIVVSRRINKCRCRILYMPKFQCTSVQMMMILNTQVYISKITYIFAVRIAVVSWQCPPAQLQLETNSATIMKFIYK